VKITYLVGDATAPIGVGHKIIVHNVNSIGAWGSGFVVALSNKWAAPEAYYRRWAALGKCKMGPFQLGQIQLVKVEPDTSVCNLVGQSGCGNYEGLAPVRYESIHEGLLRLRRFLYNSAPLEFSLHAPRLGAGISGGDWTQIETIINSVFEKTEYPFTVYDLPNSGV